MPTNSIEQPLAMSAAAPKSPTAGRLLSLDALRGFDMFWILGGDALVHALRGMSDNAWISVLDRQMDHCDWAGFHFYDLIFPLFVFIAGVSSVFSLTKTIEKEGRTVAVRRVLRRGLLLILFGIICYGGVCGNWSDVRLLGVLQRIGIAYMCAGLLFCFLRVRGLAVACAILLLGYWLLMSFTPIRDIHLNKGEFERLAIERGTSDPRRIFAETTATVTGRFEPGYNLSDHVDFQYLPCRKYFGYCDPEGLLSTLPAIGTCLLGVLAGLLLRNQTWSDRRKLAWLLGAGVTCVAMGWLWGLQFPVVKKIWTSSFVLVAGGWSAILLSVFYWMIEMRHWKRWAVPFTWIGMNAITAYLAVDGELINFHDLAERLFGGPVARLLDAHVMTGLGGVVVAMGSLAVVLTFVWYLHRKQIFLRV
jgi:predicted acyltransferase